MRKCKLEKEVNVEWNYPAVPKPIYNCRMRHPSGAYIHTRGKNQKDCYYTALKLIAKQIQDMK